MDYCIGDGNRSICVKLKINGSECMTASSSNAGKLGTVVKPEEEFESCESVYLPMGGEGGMVISSKYHRAGNVTGFTKKKIQVWLNDNRYQINKFTK
ncbi:Hypothetical predicted protein [Octopus vulgaris]|uniref:Uncharacterized protein n=1 Tax=Octopus vulgaris TaxID=6645 RepID=A0AA36BBZ1_OCTVU|nr:Hypothetical predicted protein [Octopus vulgaris]